MLAQDRVLSTASAGAGLRSEKTNPKVDVAVQHAHTHTHAKAALSRRLQSQHFDSNSLQQAQSLELFKSIIAQVSGYCESTARLMRDTRAVVQPRGQRQGRGSPA